MVYRPHSSCLTTHKFFLMFLNQCEFVWMEGSMVGIVLTVQLEDRVLASQNKEVCYCKETTCPYTYFTEQIHTIL